jgi:hypothetical protein
MKYHSEGLYIYKTFFAIIHTHFDTSIRVFHAQFSCPGAHAQNEVAGRKHRHLLDTTRALMITSFVLTYFLAEVVSLALQGGIHFERHCGKTSDYSSLHLFGYVCYVLLAPRERTKLTAQSIECVFLDYSIEHKGYHCWNPVARRMRTSWDVIFDESHSFYTCPPLMLVLPLWLILCLSYFFLMLLLLICLFPIRLYRHMCLPLSLLLWFRTTR